MFVGGVAGNQRDLAQPGRDRPQDVRIGDWVIVRRAGDVIPEVAPRSSVAG
ncbi:hypothetical protein [Thauera humireducens]|uniref:hypothetical protein n=1 Tax=Thauera humireducens TaxID=1134435 RepID=UPI00311ED7B9